MRWCLQGENAIGDLLMQTPAIRALRERGPDAEIHYFHGEDRRSHALLQGNPHLTQLHVGEAFSAADWDRYVYMDAWEALQWGLRERVSLVKGFGALLGVAVSDAKYDYCMTREEEVSGHALAQELGEGKPVVIIARHSASCSSNNPRIGIPNKCVSNTVWIRVTKWLLKEGFQPVAIGSREEESDPRYQEWPWKKLYGLPLREVAALLKAVNATLSVDTGIRHLAAAAGGNMYCISGAISLERISCIPIREGQQIFEEYRPLRDVTAEQIIAGAQRVL